MSNRSLKRREAEERRGSLLLPPSARGIPVWVTYLLALLSMVYLLNPTAGILEFLPDNLPFVGNLDEGIAFTMLWYGLVEFFEGRNSRFKGG